MRWAAVRSDSYQLIAPCELDGARMGAPSNGHHLPRGRAAYPMVATIRPRIRYRFRCLVYRMSTWSASCRPASHVDPGLRGGWPARSKYPRRHRSDASVRARRAGCLTRSGVGPSLA